MPALAIICSLVGAVLGLRFKVTILLPVIVIGWIAITSFDNARGTPLAVLVSEAAVAATAIQLGYLCGAALRRLLAAYHIGAARRDPASTRTQADQGRQEQNWHGGQASKMKSSRPARAHEFRRT
jgi:hypothetical protein